MMRRGQACIGVSVKVLPATDTKPTRFVALVPALRFGSKLDRYQWSGSSADMRNKVCEFVKQSGWVQGEAWIAAEPILTAHSSELITDWLVSFNVE